MPHLHPVEPGRASDVHADSGPASDLDSDGYTDPDLVAAVDSAVHLHADLYPAVDPDADADPDTDADPDRDRDRDRDRDADPDSDSDSDSDADTDADADEHADPGTDNNSYRDAAAARTGAAFDACAARANAEPGRNRGRASPLSGDRRTGAGVAGRGASRNSGWHHLGPSAAPGASAAPAR
jgi:hypothetical protein